MSFVDFTVAHSFNVWPALYPLVGMPFAVLWYEFTKILPREMYTRSNSVDIGEIVSPPNSFRSYAKITLLLASLFTLRFPIA